MKIKFALLAAALTAGTAIATAAAPDLTTEPALSKARLTGSFTAGAATNYTGKGYVVSRAVVGGEGIGFAALKMNYDIGKKDAWSIDSTIAYKAPVSGHTLYGNPRVSDAYYASAANAQYTALTGKPGPYTAENVKGKHDQRIGARNVENEFAIITAAKYKAKQWNVSMGHQFVHGGLYGVMAKHFRKQGASNTNEVFLAPEWTPAPWFAAGVKTSLSFQGLHGWWFEPYMTFKAPIIGTPENIKVAGVLTLSMSATAEYYNYGDFACSNGSQAFVIQLATPWFAKENLIVTPSVSFNWLGKGGMKANEKGHVKHVTGDSAYVPFKNFGVVGTLSVTYTF